MSLREAGALKSPGEMDWTELANEVERLRAEVQGYEEWAQKLIRGYVELGTAVGQRPGNRPANG